LLASGCAVRPASPRAHPSRAPVELADVPFFAQERYACGPAALATVLVHSGVPVTPDALVSRIYLPGRQGSLQVELVAAARQLDRVPYVIEPTLEAIRAELAAGRPVLVLQNLGIGWVRRWHYAVVVGSDEDAGTFTLRSGTKRRVTTGAKRFEATWNRAQRWALVALRPGELPASPDRASLLAAGAALESLDRLDSARATYRAIVRHWPEDAMAWFGLGNAEYRLGAPDRAEGAWRRALAHDPDHAAALNNLAQRMGERGCPVEARRLLERARSIADSSAVANAIAATETALLGSASSANAACEPVETAF
jgi:tetratricopeptide (TPR) repeat protein